MCVAVRWYGWLSMCIVGGTGLRCEERPRAGAPKRERLGVRIADEEVMVVLVVAE